MLTQGTKVRWFPAEGFTERVKRSDEGCPVSEHATSFGESPHVFSPPGSAYPARGGAAGTDALGISADEFRELEVSFDQASRTLWCYLRPDGPPSFTPTILRELIHLHDGLKSVVAGSPRLEPALRYYVQGSRIPGMYNMGGDFAHMVDCVQRRDRDALRRYAYDCVEAIHNIWTGFGGPIVSVCLLEGDALGGGFEGAMCCNVLIAERSVKLGLPEILFNSIPGMGAYSFLGRRIGVKNTRELLATGRVCSAEEMQELGVVDVVVDDGQGRQAVVDYIASERQSHPFRNAIFKTRQCVHPVTLDELQAVTDIWVDTALSLPAADLRRMAQLKAAQARSLRSRKS